MRHLFRTAHPLTSPVLIGHTRQGKPVWSLAGGADDDDDDEDDDGGDEDDDGDGDAADLEELAATVQELGLKPGQIKGRLDASKKWERRAKANKDAADELARIKREQLPDHEKAIEDAKAEARNAALAEVADRLVMAEFRAQLAGRLGDDQRDTLLESIDLTRYLDEDGEVDTDKVTSFIDSFVPEPDPNDRDGKGWPRDTGQGRRGSGGGKPTVASGRDLWEQRHGKSKD